MQTQPGVLVVRQSERHRCDIPARLVIDPAHAERVVLTKSARSADGSVAARVIDCSLGGLGIESSVFIPKGCRLIVVCVGDAAEEHGFAGEYISRVQRVLMLSRAPSYLIGTLHVRDASDEADATPSARLGRLIEHSKRTWGSPQPGQEGVRA